MGYIQKEKIYVSFISKYLRLRLYWFIFSLLLHSFSFSVHSEVIIFFFVWLRYDQWEELLYFVLLFLIYIKKNNCFVFDRWGSFISTPPFINSYCCCCGSWCEIISLSSQPLGYIVWFLVPGISSFNELFLLKLLSVR